MTQVLGDYSGGILGDYNVSVESGNNQWLPNGNSYITAPNAIPLTGDIYTITMLDLSIEWGVASRTIFDQGISSNRDLSVLFFTAGFISIYYKNQYRPAPQYVLGDAFPSGTFTGKLTVVIRDTLGTWSLFVDDVEVYSGAISPPAANASGGLIRIGGIAATDNINDTDTVVPPPLGWRIGNVTVNVDGSDVVDYVMPTGDTITVPESVSSNDGTLRNGTGDGADWAIIPKTEKPVITLLGVTPVDHTVNTPYFDAGATADDQKDGDITGSIITVNSVNTSVSGSYSVTYNVTNSDEIDADEVVRIVNVSGVEALDFNNVFGAALSTVTESNLASLTGSGGPFTISVTGGEYQINGGGYTSGSGIVNIGDVIQQRITSSPNYSTPVLSSVTVGGVVGNFFVTTTFDPALTASGESRLATRLGLGL
jgi:hypothetical protein